MVSKAFCSSISSGCVLQLNTQRCTVPTLKTLTVPVGYREKRLERPLPNPCNNFNGKLHPLVPYSCNHSVHTRDSSPSCLLWSRQLLLSLSSVFSDLILAGCLVHCYAACRWHHVRPSHRSSPKVCASILFSSVSVDTPCLWTTCLYRQPKSTSNNGTSLLKSL